jgi:fatty acid desaturase
MAADSAARAGDGSPARSGGSDYARLSRAVRQAGLMDRRTGNYAWRIAITVFLLAAGWVGFVLVGNSWWQLALAVFLAVMFTQVGFLGHDAGHRQICASRRLSYILGIALGNLGIGLSFGWWVTKHNRHHANPNTEGADPDIMMKVLAMTAGQADSSRGVSRLVFRCQAFLFFPMLLGEAFSVHVAGIRAVSSRARRHQFAEAVLLAAHFSAYLTVVFLVLSPVKAIVFILIQQGLFGLYLGASFAPNHKGMPILRREDKHDFLRRQVLTSRNVRGGWFTDLLLGGLNYQIEHHLFPSMPRPSLRRAQPLISEFCQQHGLPYCEAGLVGSYAQALRYLHAIGTEVPSGHLSARSAAI